jgi:hypothetical protein
MNDNADLHTGTEPTDSRDLADYPTRDGRLAVHNSQAQAQKLKPYDYETANEARKTSQASGKP